MKNLISLVNSPQKCVSSCDQNHNLHVSFLPIIAWNGQKFEMGGLNCSDRVLIATSLTPLMWNGALIHPKC